MAHSFNRLMPHKAKPKQISVRGEVRSWAERDQAQQTAWSAPGVTNVKNELTVRS